MPKTRLYQVKSKHGVRLIEAPSAHRARSHAAATEFTVDIPASHEIFAMAKAGVEIEVAGAEAVSDETRAAVSQSVIEA